MRWGVAVLAVACSGCLVIGVASTRYEVLDEQPIKTRTSHVQADVAGTQCYVDQQLRVTERVHVLSMTRVGGAFNALLFGLIATFPGKAIYAGPVAVDGLLGFFYSLRNQKTTRSKEWRETMETASCGS